MRLEKKLRPTASGLRASLLTGVAAVAAMPAFAQEEGDAEDTILVTGTRIQREDLNAPSPVTTVNSEQLVLTNTVNSEQFLNTLPQVIPSFDQTSNNPGNGTARVNLRGLGTARTLVLVDGTRFAGNGPAFLVDLNNIPSALVERIDVVTGGASAVYGSDAVAGVVNFILKDDFEGIQLDASHELSAAGWDANTTNVALTVGGDFADGRGNVVVSASYTNREALFQGDRDFSSFTYRDPGEGNAADGFILAGSANIPGGGFFSPGFNNFGLNAGTNTNFSSTTTIADIDPLCGAASTACTGFRGGDGDTINGFRWVVPAGQATDEYNYAPSNYLQLPQERYNLTAVASYEINDYIETYMRGVFSETVVDSQLAPTPAFQTLTVNNDNPSIPATLLPLITGSAANNGDGTSTFFISKRYEELGTRNSLRDTTALQLLTGARGNLNDTWSYDTYLNFTRSTNTQIQTGNISVSALQAAVLCDGGPTAVASGCTAPYVDLFGGQGGISPAGAAFITRTGAIVQEVEQTQWVGTLAGDLDSLRTPWADSGVALVLGLEYRDLMGRVTPDSVLGPDVAGFNASLPIRGRYDVYEAFGEVQIPVVTGMDFIDSFVLNGAYRYSDYSVENVGGVHTFAVGGDWSPIPEIRFRAQFQRAVRAPNIAELFSASTNGFPPAEDPCSGGNGSYSSATIVSTCIATGVPAAAIGTSIQPFGQIQVQAGGNPNLFQETADTLTLGAVWQPEAIDGLTLQVDYYDISVKNAITTVPVQLVLDECHLQGIQEQCDVIAQGRDPSGVMGINGFLAPLIPINAATIKARGIDVNASYSMDVYQGTMSLQYYGTYTMESSTQTTADAVVLECVGVFAGSCGEPTPDYKHTAQVSYIQGPLTASLRWRALTGMTASATGLSDLSDDIGFFNYLDLTTQYAVNENLDLTVGVRNITGKDVPLLGSTVNEQANTWPATYTPFGRQLFFGASVRF